VLLLDISLRFPAITLLGLISCLAVREAQHNLKARLLAVWLISLIALMLTTLPEALALQGLAYDIVWLLHTPNMVLSWWFGLSMFIDDFRLRIWHWLVLLVFLCFILVLSLLDQSGQKQATDWVLLAYRSLRALIVAHLFWVALKGHGNDLIELRRSARIWWSLTSLGYICLMIVIEAVLYHVSEHKIYFTAGLYDHPDWISTFRIALLSPFILLGSALFLRGRFDVLVFENKPDQRESRRQLIPLDQAAHKRLIHAVEEERLYQQARLSIGQLAEHIRLPEHQLRKLINQGLGHKNFSSFLNTYRLAQARRMLSDPEWARTPILNLALECGYASLATFNRAFKAHEGITPSHYRRAKLQKCLKTEK